MEDHTTHLPPHKVNRISVWRDEVAIASEPSPMSATQSAPSMAASSGSSSGASSMHSRPRLRLWRRLTRRLSGMSGAGKRDGEDAWDQTTRTEMYREENRLLQSQEHEQGQGQETSERGGLKDKQERLERAARLLGHAG